MGSGCNKKWDLAEPQSRLSTPGLGLAHAGVGAVKGIPPGLIAGAVVEALVVGMYGLARLIVWAAGRGNGAG